MRYAETLLNSTRVSAARLLSFPHRARMLSSNLGEYVSADDAAQYGTGAHPSDLGMLSCRPCLKRSV